MGKNKQNRISEKLWYKVLIPFIITLNFIQIEVHFTCLFQTPFNVKNTQYNLRLIYTTQIFCSSTVIYVPLW